MPKSTRNRSAGRVRRGRGATSTIETITRPSKSLPVVLALAIWRWRWELLITAALVAAWFKIFVPVWDKLTGSMPWGWALFCVLTNLSWPLLWRPSRRFLRNRVWCVITRHRIRACLTEMRTLNYSGNLPFIMACFSTKTGLVVWLWMRPGLSAEDLENKSETIAAACWARSAKIGRRESNASLIRVDIDRRDPLAKQHITSPLLNDTSGMPEATVNDDAVLALISHDDASSDPVTSERPANAGAPAEGRSKTSKSKYSAAVNDGQAVILGVNGEDVSDYV